RPQVTAAPFVMSSSSGVVYHPGGLSSNFREKHSGNRDGFRKRDPYRNRFRRTCGTAAAGKRDLWERGAEFKLALSLTADRTRREWLPEEMQGVGWGSSRSSDGSSNTCA